MLKKIYESAYRLFRIAGRTLIKYCSDSRPASYPYVTGDGFRKLAKFIYDDTVKNVDPANVTEGDIIFVGNSNIKNFLRDIHPNVMNKYVLISHNGDEAIDDEAVKMAEEKVIKWYGINVTTTASKVVPLPLGIENKHYYVNGIPWIFDQARGKKVEKKTKIFYAFSVINNVAERQPVLDIMKKNANGETIVKWLNFKKYINLLNSYKFIVSPPGSSVEGIRNWDAFYLGVVPIVKRSITTTYFEKIGMPLWVVDEWSELNDIDSYTLAEKYDHIIRNGDNNKIFMEYWINKIKNLDN